MVQKTISEHGVIWLPRKGGAPQALPLGHKIFMRWPWANADGEILLPGLFYGKPLPGLTSCLKGTPMRLLKTVSMIALLACATPAFAEEYVMMKVNNQDVTSAEVARVWEGLFPPGQAPDFTKVDDAMRERVLRAVMAERILLGEATKAGVDKTESFTRELEDIKRKQMVRVFLEAKTADMITDSDLKKEYEADIAKLKDEREVRARHILVPTEDEAKAAKKKLSEGKSFEDVAKELSKDPGSAKQGGDLGYFTRDKMVKEFADAAFALKKGEVSAPVKSPFGFHIIKMEDSRKVKAPTFNEVKDQLRARLQEKKLNDYVEGLVKAANVKVFDAKGKELDFEKDLPKDGDAKPREVKPAKAVEKPAEKKAEDAKPAEPEKKPE
jgi:peptidyl-prolyl cis-trans isomerase C